MKKIVTILLVFVSLATVAQNTHKQSNANTVEQFQGAVETKAGLINAHFSDTTEANLSWIKTKPFAQIVTGDGVTWLRNGTATKWIGTGSASINISSDSTSLIICNGSGTCDTIPVVTVAPITNFTILNDTTIEVCGINSCDTIYTLPINYNQNVVNSVSVVNGVSVDSVFYFINGVKYLAGTITHSSANTSVDGLISGGIVSWSGTGLTFDIQAAVFRIFGVTYYTRDTTITLDPADPTYSRIDLFALDTTNGGEVVKITGTPSPTPVAPQTQDFQIALTTGITLNVGDTVPSNVTQKIIYDETTVSPEWTISTVGNITMDSLNTDNPYHLMHDIFVSEYNNIGRNPVITFTDFTIDTFKTNDVLQFAFYTNGKMNNPIYFDLLKSGMYATKYIILNNSSSPYINSNDSNNYVQVTIPLNNLTWVGDGTYNAMRLGFLGSDTSGTKGLYLDYIRLQSGVPNIPSPTDYSNKADSTTTKKLNDSTYVGLYWVKGIPYQKGDTIKIHSTTIDSINVSILSGGKIDTSHLPVSNIYIQQAGAGETHIVRAADDTTLSVATLKNTDDITISKASDSSVLLQFTHPHYTKDQIDSIKATITADGITRAELIDTANNKVNKTDISGGTINQVLKKNSSTDYDWSWQDEAGGGKDSSAYHTIQALGDTALVICDLQGRCDTTIFSAHTVWSKNGNYAYYNSGNVGIGTNTPPSLLTLLKPTSNAVPDDSLGLALQTSTDATSGNPTASLPLVFGTKAWVTSASASQDAKFKIYARGNNGTATGNLFIDFSGNGAAYTNAITIGQNGNLTTNNITAGTISGSNISGNSFTVSRNVNNGSSFTDNTTFIAPSSLTTYRSFYYNPTWTASSIAAIDVRAFDNTIGNNVFNRTRGSTSIGTDSTVVGAKLAVTSTTSAFLPPRMTKAQRDSIYSGFTGSITNAGSGTRANTTLNIELAGGSGIGAVAALTIVSNQVTSVTIIKYGSGYAVGDVLTNATSIGLTGFTWTISAITPPKAGSVIYQTDNTPGIRVFNGTNWMKFTETAD